MVAVLPFAMDSTALPEPRFWTYVHVGRWRTRRTQQGQGSRLGERGQRGNDPTQMVDPSDGTTALVRTTPRENDQWSMLGRLPPFLLSPSPHCKLCRRVRTTAPNTYVLTSVHATPRKRQRKRSGTARVSVPSSLSFPSPAAKNRVHRWIGSFCR